MLKVKFLIFATVSALLLLAIAIQNTFTSPPVKAAANPIKIAFIGDTEYDAANTPAIDTNFEKIMQLILDEGAVAVIHSGDFDYHDDPQGFFANVDRVLGPNFPYFGSLGNHDIASWNVNCGNPKGCYATYFKDRYARIGVPISASDTNIRMYTFNYQGLRFVFTGQQTIDEGNNKASPYIDSVLKNSAESWKICGWHRNQKATQLGDKNDTAGWKSYETCLTYGAIAVGAHEHSYGRSKTLTSFKYQTVDTLQHPVVNGVPSNPDSLIVAPGRSFFFYSGLGGDSIREQTRCLPSTYPYGCNYEWAKAYTATQGANYGALFITFNADGDETKGTGYFKNIDGNIVDTFTISLGGTSTPTPTSVQTPTSTTTPTLTPTSTPTSTITPTPVEFPGDANGDGYANEADYQIWKSNYGQTTTEGASVGDFNGDLIVDGVDYVIWVNAFSSGGDANGDGFVNDLDYQIWLNNYGQTTTEGASVGDFNGDLVVDGIDYIIWVYGYTG